MASPLQIVDEAMQTHFPVAVWVGYSGGNDSLRVTHWAMTHIKTCRVMHINTGIGIERTRRHVRKVCADFGWPLDEIRAKEDCGQDYDEIVAAHGFPGPSGHSRMYMRLKERCVRVLVRRAKEGKPRHAKVMFLSGVHHADSERRMRYAGKEAGNAVGSQIWVNPFYWSSKAERDAYIAEHKLPINPVTAELGMSGECGCGAFAQPGEIDHWRKCDPTFGERIDKLEQRVLAKGFTWKWGSRPPESFSKDQMQLLPLCGDSCYKSAIVQAELTGAPEGGGQSGNRSLRQSPCSPYSE